MEQEEKKRPKATAELAKEYDALRKKMKECRKAGNKVPDELYKRMYEMWDQYDWLNIVFTDTETGKMGVKDVAGRILIPARYDEISCVASYTYAHTVAQAVKRDGKYGIVAADGSGKELSDFRFDDANWEVNTNLYFAQWDGDKEHYGFIDASGKVVCPNILTDFSEVDLNDIIFIESHGKQGVIDASTHLCVLPEYDDVESFVDDFIVFHKDGKEGYITNEGEFVTREQYEKDEKYDKVHFLNCMAKGCRRVK